MCLKTGFHSSCAKFGVVFLQVVFSARTLELKKTPVSEKVHTKLGKFSMLHACFISDLTFFSLLQEVRRHELCKVDPGSLSSWLHVLPSYCGRKCKAILYIWSNPSLFHSTIFLKRSSRQARKDQQVGNTERKYGILFEINKWVNIIVMDWDVVCVGYNICLSNTWLCFPAILFLATSNNFWAGEHETGQPHFHSLFPPAHPWYWTMLVYIRRTSIKSRHFSVRTE